MNSLKLHSVTWGNRTLTFTEPLIVDLFVNGDTCNVACIELDLIEEGDEFLTAKNRFIHKLFLLWDSLLISPLSFDKYTRRLLSIRFDRERTKAQRVQGKEE